MRKSLILAGVMIACLSHGQQPKIVVGIVVDQMRQDYLLKFSDGFGPDGFNRILQDGYAFRNAHYNYTPTYTGPGHASIYTGTTPSEHGIIANDWFNKASGLNMYCVSDTKEQGVGGSDQSGKISPRNLKATTITDELRMNTNFQAKVVGISIKDRGAVLPAGHHPTGSYWFDSKTGNFMTSTYYYSELPNWVADFNNRGLTSTYLNRTWTPSDKLNYSLSTGDENAYERPFRGQDAAIFPYNLSELVAQNGQGLIRTTPYGNTIVMDMGIAAIEGEQLGQDDVTDFLALSFSSTDYIGHAFGPNSIEVQDTYLKLDAELARLLHYLDEKFGEDYVVFITADHGVVRVPLFLTDNRMPGGYWDLKTVNSTISEALTASYGEGDWIRNGSNDQIFLNQSLIAEKGLDLKAFRQRLKAILLDIPEVHEAYTYDELAQRNGTSLNRQLLENGFNSKMSGDIIIRFKSGYLVKYGDSLAGTSHGSGYTYDTHIPILFFGQNVKSGGSVRRVSITDIAPTLSMLLNVALPSAATGSPLYELFD